MTRSLVARASYTIDLVRSLAFETAVRQNGAGVYAKAEYSQARGQHWRATLTGVASPATRRFSRPVPAELSRHRRASL